MSKSIKLKDDTYIDSSGIIHNKEKLSDILNKPVACNYNDWKEQQVIEGTGQIAILNGFDTTITTHGGNILVAVSIPMTHSGGTCWLSIWIDGNEIMKYGVSHNVGLLSYTNIFPVSSGTHRVYVTIQNNNVSQVTIYNYTSKAFTVAEV